MKNFEKPFCEVVRFGSSVMTASDCGCYDELLGVQDSDCIGDIGYCACTVNHNPAIANCTPA